MRQARAVEYKNRNSQWPPRWMAAILQALGAAAATLLLISTPAYAADASAQFAGPRIWLGDAQSLTALRGALGAAKSATASANPLAMASADFDGDGIADLAVGYSTPAGFVLSVRRGNLDAFAPTNDASFKAIIRGEFPAPFLDAATTITLPASPDFIAAGRFTGNGYVDLVVAAKGGTALYLLSGDGHGGFAAPKAIAVDGNVTALAAGMLAGGQGLDSLLVGVSGSQNALLRYSGSQQGLTASSKVSLTAAVSQIAIGSHEQGLDAAMLAGGRVLVLQASGSTMQVQDAALPVAAAAMALGHFIYDRDPRMQIALLASDGSVQIAAHDGFDPRTLTVAQMQSVRSALRRGDPNPVVPKRATAVLSWNIVEAIPGAATFRPGQAPLFFRARISDHGGDDLMILDGAAQRFEVIAHPDSAPGSASFQRAQISTRPYAGAPVAAAALRVNIDGRPGVVSLNAGQAAPMVMMPLPDPTFTVNRTDDPTPTSPITNACNGVSSCSLREALLLANATAGTDTIAVPAGTYTLTLPKVANDFTGNHGALYVNDSVNILGAGQATTIIQAGGNNAAGVDMVMAVNEDISPLTDATASISNLTLKFGHNRGTHGNDGDGGCMEFDTGTSGNANLTLTNVTLDSCSTTFGNGGGIALFDFLSPGTGLATFTNVIIQNNSAVDGTSGVAATAGGIWVSNEARMSMSNSQVLNNSATQVTGGVGGEGGGITLNSNAPSPQSTITGSVISGNQATGNGGGIHNEVNLLITGTSITNNSAGSAGLANAQDGGGLWTNTAVSESAILQKVTITGNTAKLNGGGIAMGNNSGAGSLTMNFSRLAGNTAPNGSNLSNNSSTAGVTDNWWGTNTPSSTISTVSNSATGTTTFDPFIVLGHTAAPSTLKINTAATLTADMSKDNHGTSISATNLNVLVGLPVTFANAVDGTIPQAQPETLNSSAKATATFNAGANPGGGSADATVDQQTVTADIVVLAPLQVVKTFSPTVVPIDAGSTLTFAVSNPNVVAVDASFTDTLPSGLVVAAIPGATNTCGGTVTATAGSGSVSFSNASLPVGNCSITVKVSGTTDNVYNNSVTLDSTAAGTGALSTSSASLTVINPPAITKGFGAATLPLNGVTTLTFNLSSTNANLTLTGVAFTDSLPAGLVVATPSSLTDSCGGSVQADPGASSVSLSGGTLVPSGACVVSVNVQGTIDGVKNNSVTVTSTNGGTGNTSNASITVAGPPVLSKAFGAASIPLGGSTSLSFTIQNNNTTAALSGVGFTDTLPAGLVVSTPSGLTGSCGAGTITATQGANGVSLSGATLPANSSCTFAVNVTGTAAGLQSNTTGNVTSTEGGTGGTASASINVVAPPSIAKVFNPASIALNATTSLTFTITNPVANNVSFTGVAFTDVLPTGLTVANASATVCGGTLTATAPTGIALSGATIAPNSQCQFSVTVTGAASGVFTNTTGNVTSTNGGTGNTASATLSVATPPSITKAFGAASIPLNGTTTLTFAITNPNVSTSLTGLAFTDSMPTGLVVATPNGLTTTCGPVTAAAGSGSVTLAGGTLAANGTCSVAVNVQGATAGVQNNSVTVSATESGPGNTSNASITVLSAPVLLKAFGAASIPLNGSTSLSFTVQNNNATSALSGVAFSDTLPAGLVLSTPNGLTGSCGGGTITASQGGNAITLAGASLAASSSCTFSVNVTGVAAGQQNNTTGNVTSTDGGTGGTASASLNVAAPPSIVKAFNPQAIALNATTSLTFTITNPPANGVALTGVAFTDVLPTGLTVTNASATVCGGTLTTTAPTGIALSGATIAANAQCQFSVTVTGAAAGAYSNTTGNVNSTNGGTGNTASATLSVATPPSITKSFGAPSIALNGITTLSFSISNPNVVGSLTGVSFTDSMPAGLVVATPNGLTGSCGGGTITAAAGGGSVSLAGATLAANASCNFSVKVQGTTAGAKNNSVTVSANESGAGNTSSASITVATPPTLTKAFGAASIPLNGTTSLSFTVQNANATTGLSGIAFTDAFPAGLAVATPNGLTGSCGAGTITATAGSGTVSLAGATLAANASCTFAVNVTATASGAKNNTTGAVTSTEGGTGGTASATLGVEGPPAIAKAFNPASIAVNGASTLTLTITNPVANTAALTGVAVTDTLPASMVVATPNALVNTCGGVATATAGSGIVSLTGGTVPASGACTVSLNVTSSAAGSLVNVTGAVTSTNGGTGNTATATLGVAVADLTISATHGGAFVQGQTGASYTLTVSDVAGAGPTSGTVTVVDTLPPNTVVATAMSGTGWSCTLATLTCTRSDALAAGASYPPITLTVDVPATLQSGFTNTATVSGGGETNTANDTASDATAVVFRTFTGPIGTGGGNATVSFTGGGPTCTFAPQGTGALQSAFFIPVTGSAKSPAAAPPPGVTFPEGLLDFVLLACDGSPITFTVTYPNALPSGLVYWKYGPTASDASPHWYQLPATFGAASATFTITDGGLGDDDLAANGTIVDQGGPGTPGPGIPSPVPALDERALALLGLVLVAFGLHAARKRGGSATH